MWAIEAPLGKRAFWHRCLRFLIHRSYQNRVSGGNRRQTEADFPEIIGDCRSILGEGQRDGRTGNAKLLQSHG